ncbi:hypothetical protein K443DRAFT_126556, partial [Laccaria amethystina LaAM-08-1]
MGRALGLLQAPSSDEFQRRAQLIIRDFPKLKSWMEWWMRPAHASILFKSERVMDLQIWKSLPATNNAEEAMHWKLYSACGRDHRFLEGMNALYAVATHYQRLIDGVLKGALIRYGAAEPWKAKAAAIGRTKPTRAPNPEAKKRKKNDGRPPDTIKELLLKPQKNAPSTVTTTKKAASKVTMELKFGPPSYRWKPNSCWLDASLQVLYIAITKKFDEFGKVFNSLETGSPLNGLYLAFNKRFELDPEESNATTALGLQRDRLRMFLKQNAIIEELDQFDSPVVHLENAWLPMLARLEYKKQYSLAVAYFMIFSVTLSQCSGSSEIGGGHTQ